MAFEIEEVFSDNIVTSHLILHPSIIGVKQRFMAIIEAYDVSQKFVIVDYIHDILLNGTTGQINSVLGGYSRGSKEAALAWHQELKNFVVANPERVISGSQSLQSLVKLPLSPALLESLESTFQTITAGSRTLGEILRLSTLYLIPVATFGRDHHWTLRELDVPTLEIQVACLPILKALSFRKRDLLRRLKEHKGTVGKLGRLFLFLGLIVLGDRVSLILLPSLSQQSNEYKELLSLLGKLGTRFGIAVIERNGVPW